MKELDVVALKSGKDGLAAGSNGTIVHKHVKGEIFIVEFCDHHGRTITLEDLSHEELELIWEYKP